MAKLIDGRALARQIRQELKEDILTLRNQHNLVPGLTVILVGDDPASHVYVRNKERACSEVGIHSNVIRMNAEVTEKELLDTIEGLNNDDKVHGILVQLPLPDHINEKAVINAIKPAKDVDGFHPVNSGMLMTGQAVLEPCTPKGIIRLIEETGCIIAGKHAVVIGQKQYCRKAGSNDAASETCYRYSPFPHPGPGNRCR